MPKAVTSGDTGERTAHSIDVEVVWSPMVFRNRFAALTMVTDVTERCRNEHRNQVFSKLSHRLEFGHHGCRSGDDYL